MELRELLRNCIIVRSEYLRETDKSSSKSRQQEFARAIADKDKQIAQVESQIKERSHSEQSSPSLSTIALDEIRRDGGTQPRVLRVRGLPTEGDPPSAPRSPPLI